MKEEPIAGQAPANSNEVEVFWKEQGRELLKRSISAIEAAGKQLITLLTTMQGIYLGVVAYSEFTKKLADIPPWQHFLLVIPLLIWLIALYFALKIFHTQEYTFHPDDVEAIRKSYQTITALKQKNLDLTYRWIVAGLVVAVFDIVIYFMWIAP